MIAIIGSSGLLGARVVERLTAKGHEVLAASRKERTDLPVGARPAVVDLRKPKSIRAVLEDVVPSEREKCTSNDPVSLSPFCAAAPSWSSTRSNC